MAKAFLKLRHICPDFRLVKEKVQCKSSDTLIHRDLDNAAECAAYCRAQDGCNFFLLKRPNGTCYWEKTSDASCPEGFKDHQYNFYELLNSGENKSLAITSRYIWYYIQKKIWKEYSIYCFFFLQKRAMMESKIRMKLELIVEVNVRSAVSKCYT